MDFQAVPLRLGDVYMTKNRMLELVRKNNFYIISKKDIERFAECAADAYQTYPLFKYFLGDKHNKENLKNLWKVILKSFDENAICYSESKEVNGMVIWFVSDFNGTSAFKFLSSGGIFLPFSLGLGTLFRMLKYENHAVSVRKKYTNNTGLYLYNASVKTKAQGTGLLSKLIKPILKLSDEIDEIIYLETHNEDNVPLYEHYKFELCEANFISKTNLTHYAMIRAKKTNY